MYFKAYSLQRCSLTCRYTSKLLLIGCVCIWSLVCCHLYLSTCHSCNTERRDMEWVTVVKEDVRWLPKMIYQSNKVPDMGMFLNSEMFVSQGRRLLWIRQRIARLSEDWERAFEGIKQSPYIDKSTPKNLLIFPGLLSEFSPYNFADNAYKGGYLGELIQWSDLIAGLYILGHRVTVVTQRESILALKNTSVMFDLVFTDYTGLIALENMEMFVKYKCNIRVLDVYGTEPMYNFRTANFNMQESYANWNLEDTKQFWTFYPDTPDNTFLGFIVPQVNNNTRQTGNNKNIAVVYGKLAQSLYSQRHNIPLLQMVSEFFEVHSTFREAHPHLPENIINHGFLNSNDLALLLQRAKLFVGLGYPYDGPGPFEALAEGAVFLQHKFSTPKSRENDRFFDGKPTSRAITSQHSYLEKYIGEPYVYTIDTTDADLVRSTLIKILKSRPLPPFIPYEFTSTGFLERLAVTLARQEICDGDNIAGKKQVNSSPHYEGFSASYITDDRMENRFCFLSQPGTKPWIEVDLDTEVWIRKIRVTVWSDWKTAVKLNVFNSFKVSLLDYTRVIYVEKNFMDGRLSYVWDEINLPARFVQIVPIEMTSEHFVICGLEVFKRKTRGYTAADTLIKKISDVGESCKDTCFRNGYICDRSLFPQINSLSEIQELLNCSFSMGPASHAPDFIDYAPAQYMTTNNKPGMCIVNPEPMLFSCAGKLQSAVRVCPCVETIKGQNSLHL